jgi:4'-phosphopantetheinyl transferase
MISLDSPQGTPRVDVWAVWLTAPAAVSSAFRGLISSDEVFRADRFAFDHLRHAYQVSHGVLRVLLAQYLECSPRALEFTLGPMGKPALLGGGRLRFNMSHSGELAVYAFTFDCEIGVDIEQARDTSGIEQIAERYFCPEEASELLSIPGGKARQDAFFRCWTRKESYIKATGDGLSATLDQFQVTLLPEAPARFVHIGHDASAAAKWTLHHLEPVPGYVGALAYHAGARHIELHPPQQAQDILATIR